MTLTGHFLVVNRLSLDRLSMVPLQIPAPGRLRQEDHELKAGLVYIMTPCLKKENKHYIAESGWTSVMINLC
jgi:hypothetical protein